MVAWQLTPKKPVLHEQLYEFTRLLHTPAFWQGEERHSLRSVHVKPSPEYPGRQAHVRDPAVLPQVAKPEHPPLETAHSFTSEHKKAPLLVYPAGQEVHEKLPALFTHGRSASQPPLDTSHSFTSEHKKAPLLV
jgi:hypothetical protein